MNLSNARLVDCAAVFGPLQLGWPGVRRRRQLERHRHRHAGRHRSAEERGRRCSAYRGHRDAAKSGNFVLKPVKTY